MNWNEVREPRRGVMLHYSAGSFDGTVAWCQDPVSKVSYQLVVGQDGRSASIAPLAARAWHAGVCRSSDPARLPYRDANSAFYGVALAATDGDQITPLALEVLVQRLQSLFDSHRWPVTEGWRIVGHDSEAWPRGRKIDPRGSGPVPVIDVDVVRQLVADS